MYTSLDVIAELAHQLFWARMLLTAIFAVQLANMCFLILILSTLRKLADRFTGRPSL